MAEHFLLIPSVAVELMPGQADSDSDLNALASAEGVIATVTLSILKPYIRFWLRCRYAVAPAAGAYCSLWMLNSLNGTDFEDGSVASRVITTPAKPADWAIPLRAVDTQQVISSPVFFAPYRNFKVLFHNSGGQALTNTANENEIWYEQISEGPATI